MIESKQEVTVHRRRFDDNFKQAQVVARLHGLCFVEECQRGSHKQFRHADGRGTTVPFHQGRDIGMTTEEFWPKHDASRRPMPIPMPLEYEPTFRESLLSSSRAIRIRCARWQVFQRYHMQQRDTSDAIINRRILKTGMVNAQVAMDNQHEIGMINVEPQALLAMR
ncbi:MAG: type II toxin-antitoxin system HicA family toxin [Pirellulales bacterium]|nr:type II toxin-antitoxin system HicA family toxin [Pirellulales bacterium]